MSLLNVMPIKPESVTAISTGASPSFSRRGGGHLPRTSTDSWPRPVAHSLTLDLVRRNPILASLSDQDLNAVLTASRSHNVRRKDPIWHQGDAANAVILLLEGHAKLWTPLADGSEALLEIVGPGESAGAISVLQELPRDSNLSALSYCRFMATDARQFRQILHGQPNALFAVLRANAERLRQARDQLADSRTLSGRARLAKTLLSLARLSPRDAGGSVRLPMRLSQSELGSMAGLCREIVNKCLGAWRDAGWIELSAGTLVSFDIDVISAIPREDEFEEIRGNDRFIPRRKRLVSG